MAMRHPPGERVDRGQEGPEGEYDKETEPERGPVSPRCSEGWSGLEANVLEVERLAVDALGGRRDPGVFRNIPNPQALFT